MNHKKRIIGEILISMAIPVLCTCARIVKDSMDGYEPNLLSMVLYVLFLSVVTVPFLFLKDKKRKFNGFAIFLICVLVAVDQLVKIIIYRQGDFEIELISKGLSLKPSYNMYHTAMLSFLQLEINAAIIMCVKILTGLIMIVGVYLVMKKNKMIEEGVILLVLFCSGLFSSLVDSLVWGYTLDYICFPFYTVIDLKDIYLFIWGNLFVVYMLRVCGRQKELKGNV